MEKDRRLGSGARDPGSSHRSPDTDTHHGSRSEVANSGIHPGQPGQTHTRVYSTLDSYVAGYLLFRGVAPILRWEGSKVVFSFDMTEEVVGLLARYHTGDSVPALQFAHAIKSLRTMMHSARRDNGDRRNLAGFPSQ